MRLDYSWYANHVNHYNYNTAIKKRKYRLTDPI